MNRPVRLNLLLLPQVGWVAFRNPPYFSRKSKYRFRRLAYRDVLEITTDFQLVGRAVPAEMKDGILLAIGGIFVMIRRRRK